MLFVITCSDGETDIRVITEEEFTRELNDGDYGESPGFITELNIRAEPNYWPENTILVLRGELVVPTPVSRVSEWGIPPKL